MNTTNEQLMQAAIQVHCALIASGAITPGRDPKSYTKWSVSVAKALLNEI